MRVLDGITVSKGLSKGKSVIYESPEIIITNTTTSEPEKEIDKLNAAVTSVIEDLVELKERVRIGLGEDNAHIFRSQQTIVEDPSIQDEIKEHIRQEQASAESAVKIVFDTYASMFYELEDDSYNKARVTDLEDLAARLLRKILGTETVELDSLEYGSIIVAKELFPSETVLIDPNKVVGIITEKGGITSHVAIIAGSLGIPAAVGVKNAVEAARNGKDILLDAGDELKTIVVCDPDKAEHDRFEKKKNSFEERQRIISAVMNRDAVTADRHRILVSGNIGSDEELESGISYGMKSVGLFRTEFLFLSAVSAPTEEEQFKAYKRVAETLSDGMVIIRTLDVGGDKNIKYIPIEEEDNPFLGMRAIRVSLKESSMFKSQIRAVLRASAFGNVKIMFPMIGSIGEVSTVKQLVDEAMAELSEEKIEFDDSIEIGIMIEIPSAVFMARELAREVDFMSIGTNDLTQYLLAADRLNENISEYYEIFHPAVFRSINMIVDAAHSEGIWVGVCGELGGIPKAIPALIGLGVDELSMSPKKLPEAVYTIRNTSYEEAVRKAKEIVLQEDADGVKSLL
jgi:phosphoenolpyruvate-protein phosphotransferase (PTS system enzyme I)